MAERCEQVRELIPEVALGLAPGDERARVLAHVEGCPECRAALARAASTVDGLLLLAPEHEPPPGFDSAVLAAMAPAREPRRWTSFVLAAAAAVLVALVAGGVTHWMGAEDRQLADQYRQTLDVADGRYLRAADLTTSTGTETGHVFAYEGRPSWVFMTVEGAPSGDYTVTLVDVDGTVHDLGWCEVRDGTGSWGTTVQVPVHSIDHIEMRQGATTLTARFGDVRR
jgi:hypothetical protein